MNTGMLLMGRIRNFFKALEPPPQWKPGVIILLGVMVGIAFLLFHASEAHSYLSNQPETCINCHVMYPQYATWAKGSHRERATCAECHVPQDNFVRQYYVKATDGLWHASVFTARAEPQVIKMRARGIGVVQENCIRCHLDLVEMTSLVEVNLDRHQAGEGKVCWDCHRNVPHGTTRSLAATPHSLVQRLPRLTPGWLRNLFSREE
jgi:cytochrome c nitrite reductase small subunit